jgi:hypothetical protein
MKMLYLLPVLSPVNLLNSGVCCNCILVYFWCNETGCSFSSYVSHHTCRSQSEMSPSESGSSISSIISSLFNLCGIESEAESSEVPGEVCKHSCIIFTTLILLVVLRTPLCLLRLSTPLVHSLMQWSWLFFLVVCQSSNTPVTGRNVTVRIWIKYQFHNIISI